MPRHKDQTVIWVDREVHRNIKAVAAAKGMTIQALAESALLEWCLAQPEVRSGKKGTKPLAVRL
jgi:hypothetical protein